MGNTELRRTETGESQSEKKSSSKPQDSSSFYECMKNGLGVAAAGAWKTVDRASKVVTAGLAIQAGLGIRGVQGFSASGSGTELQVRGNDENTTALHPYSEGASTRQERAFNPANVTPEALKRFKKLGVKHPEKLVQGMKQGKYGSETAPELREQGNDKGRKSLKSGKEEIDTLQSFLDALKQDRKAQQGFKDVWKDKEILEGIKNLMDNDNVKEYLRFELKNKENVKQAISSLENPNVLQDLKNVLNNVLNNKKYMQVIENLIQDKEFRGRALLEARNNVPWEKLSLKNGTNITGTELADIRTRLHGRQDILNLTEGYNLSTAQFQAVRREIEQSSDQLLAAAWQLDSTYVLAYEELSKPVDNVQTQIHLFKVDETSHTMRLIAKNVNTVDTFGPRVAMDQSQVSCSDQCNQYGCCTDSTYPCAYISTNCLSMNFQCSFSVCAGCALSCANPVTCAACLVAFCPVVSYISCCNWGPGLTCEPSVYCNC